MRQLYRQGDVLIAAVDEIPLRASTPKTDDEKRIVLAHGEATGHAHVIHARPTEARVRRQRGRRATWREPATPDRTFLEVLSPTGVELVHDEHETILLPPGAYEVTRQREYDPDQARLEARVRD